MYIKIFLLHIKKNGIQKKNNEGKKWSEIMTFQEFFNSKINQMDSGKLAELEKNKVKYDQDEQKLSNLGVSFSNGQIMQNNKAVADGQYMFVLSPDGKNLYLAPKKKGIFHHSSFLSGGAVKSAGMVEVKNGKVDTIYQHSGHYKPTEQQMDAINVYLSDQDRMGDLAKNIRYVGGTVDKLQMFKNWIKSKIGLP